MHVWSPNTVLLSSIRDPNHSARRPVYMQVGWEKRQDMDDRKIWRPSRYGVLLVVLALHVTVIALLIASSNVRLSVPTVTLIEVVFPPPATAQRVRTITAPSPPLEVTRVTPSVDATLSLSPQLVPAVGTFGIPIDWADQVRTVADSVAANTDTRESVLAPGPTPQKSIFAEPPAHHAGEQHRLDTGEWIVFISDNCYQISSAIPTVPIALGNGIGPSTFCIDNSNTPRGDLFDQLPAYKRHHPN